MVASIYGALARPRNAHGATRSASPTPVHPGLVDHPLVGPDVQVALLAAVDQTGDLAIGDLVAVLPDHPQPLNAVLALVDAGYLALDLDGPFDADCRVWRIASPSR